MPFLPAFDSRRKTRKKKLPARFLTGFISGKFLFFASRPLAWFFVLSAVFLSGCATIETFDFGEPKPVSGAAPEGIPYRDYQGVMHVHSRYSLTSKGRFDEIARAAVKTHTDFVVVADHNTLRGLKEKMEGFYGAVLILIGTELTTPDGHLLALGIEEEADPRDDLSGILDRIERAGGVSFVAHGELPGKSWTDWSLAPLTGMEIYTLADDYCRPWKMTLAMKLLFLSPRAFFDSIGEKPDDLLRRWDTLLETRTMVGIGSADAHQKWRLFGKPVDGYAPVFSAVQTHVWARELSKPAIIEALKEGRAYVTIGASAPSVRNFSFAAETPQERIFMGSHGIYEKGTVLKVDSPEPGEIRILRNGRLLSRETGRYTELEIPAAGVYRVEVYRKKKLWILSNPIYLSD